jgi:hypothetical protein
MLPAPFYAEIPHDLGHDAAWLGRDVMQALLRLRRHQPSEPLAAPVDEQPSALLVEAARRDAGRAAGAGAVV